MTDDIHEVLRPTTLDEAHAVLRQAGAERLEIGPRVPDRLYADAEQVVDLSGLGLTGLQLVAGELRLGSQVVLQTLVEHDGVRGVAGGVLSDAAWWSATSALRGVATLGGALTAPGGPPELRAVLLALEAHVAVQGARRQDLPLATWSGLGSGDLLLEVRVPATAGPVVLERVARAPRDEAILVVAVGRAGAGAIVAAGQSTGRVGVWRFDRAGGDVADQVAREIEVTTDLRATADYRRAMARVLCQRGLARLE